MDLDYRERRFAIYDRIRRFYNQPEANRSKIKWLDIINEIKDYNDRIKERGLRGIEAIITSASIRENLKQSFQPKKKEFVREGGAQFAN